MKKFDPHWGKPEMPKNVKEAFFDNYRYDGIGNGCWVEFEVGYTDFVEEKHSKEEKVEDYQLVSKWLIKQGCKIMETVMIKHWW